MNRRSFFTLSAIMAAGLPGCRRPPAGPNDPVRFGHFPNVTHVHGLVAQQMTRRGQGWYEPRLGVPVQWFIYNAGPSATEAIFAGSLDVTYIGPSPVLNAYTKAKGTEMRVLAGAANGGNSLVLRAGSGIESLDDFRGKRIASPQLGNTQDIQLRGLLTAHGYQITLTGGDVFIVPTANADLLRSFQLGHVDGAWAPEPFASMLELQAGAENFLEDREINVTMLVSSVAFLRDRPDLARKLVAAHLELTAWIKAHPEEARALVIAELTEQTSKAPDPDVVDKALSRVVITNEISRPSLEKLMQAAQAARILRTPPSLDQLLSELPKN